MLQTRLLRVIEEREVVPLGSDQSIPVDLHVISATHRDIRQMIAAGEFRDDLYYRLNGITLQLPLLRERAATRPISSTPCCAKRAATIRCRSPTTHSASCSTMPGPAISASCATPCVRHRRCAATIRYVFRTCRRKSSTRSCARSQPHLHQSACGCRRTSPRTCRPPPLREAECAALLGELERMRWNISRTAQSLGISRNTLYRKIHKHKIVSHALKSGLLSWPDHVVANVFPLKVPARLRPGDMGHDRFAILVQPQYTRERSASGRLVPPLGAAAAERVFRFCRRRSRARTN